MSHETIYKNLFIQARGVLKKELLEHLRAKRTIRRSRHASVNRDGRLPTHRRLGRRSLSAT